MDELLEKIRGWDARLTDWNRGFAQEWRKLRRKRSGLFRRLSAAEEEEVAAEARRATGEGLLVELFAFFDELCGDYLKVELPQDAAKLRAAIGERPALFNALWSYVEQAPDLIRSAEDARRVELALAAVSLDDSRVDLEQFQSATGRIYVAAAHAGIDPAPAFQAAAQISNPGSGGGGAGTKALLSGFDSSFYFAHHVRPQIARSA